MKITDEMIYSIIRTLDAYARFGNPNSGLPCNEHGLEEMKDLVVMILIDNYKQQKAL